MTSPLDGIRVLDLTRVLAGPLCTQILGDMGAEIIKIEKPGSGDDTRHWGPPFLKGKDGDDTGESAYFLCANRNKRSVAIDLSTPGGADLVRALAVKSDVLVHNFKPGALEQYGLGYGALHAACPRLVYAAISGFGQDGPMAQAPGYDLMAQAMGGLMAHTGAADAEPTKAGVALVDVMTGLYAAVGILAALRARDLTGKGQMVDLALLDVTLAGMANLAQYYLTSGTVPPRLGNGHATIVPYQSFKASDGHLVVAVGNDAQFRRFAQVLGQPGWADDPRFARNAARVNHRLDLVPLIAAIMGTASVADWCRALTAAGVPATPVNDVGQVFALDQIRHRGMETAMPHPQSPGPVRLVGNPLHFSETPVSYRHAPPTLGQDGDDVLGALLSLTPEELASLKARGIVG